MIFLKNKELILTYSFALLLACIICLTISFITQIYNLLWIIPILIILMLFACSFLWDDIFTKVEINKENIVFFYRKKIKANIQWQNITKVERTLNYLSQNLTIYTNDNKEYRFNISKVKARKIAEICPNENIKKQIENIKFPFDFSKRKN